MTEQEIKDGIVLIAHFMELPLLRKEPEGYWIWNNEAAEDWEAIPFYNTWGGIMPVVEHILKDRESSHFQIGSGYCNVVIDGTDFSDLTGDGSKANGYQQYYENEETLLAVFKAVLVFVEWYNVYKGKNSVRIDLSDLEGTYSPEEAEKVVKEIQKRIDEAK